MVSWCNYSQFHNHGLYRVKIQDYAKLDNIFFIYSQWLDSPTYFWGPTNCQSCVHLQSKIYRECTRMLWVKDWIPPKWHGFLLIRSTISLPQVSNLDTPPHLSCTSPALDSRNQVTTWTNVNRLETSLKLALLCWRWRPRSGRELSALEGTMAK